MDKLEIVPKRLALRRGILANNIDGTFNCVVHERLTDILTCFHFQTNRINCIDNFIHKRLIQMPFNNKPKIPPPFLAGLPQGSPLSHLLFVIYAEALGMIEKYGSNESITAYLHDSGMVHWQQIRSLPRASYISDCTKELKE